MAMKKNSKHGYLYSFSWNVVVVVVVVVIWLTYCGWVSAAADPNLEQCLADGTCDAASPPSTTTTTTQQEDDDVVATTSASMTIQDDSHNNNPTCQDKHPEKDCFVWAVMGECETNPTYMLPMCQKSCRSCDQDHKGVVIDEKLSPASKVQSSTGAIKVDTEHTRWGVEQEISGTDQEMAATIQVMDKTREYMLQKVLVLDQYQPVREDCKNLQALCSFWASLGECNENRDYMMVQCGPACLNCDGIDFETRCGPFDPNSATMDNVWNLNLGLNEMFQRIITNHPLSSSSSTTGTIMKVHRGPYEIRTKIKKTTLVPWDDATDGPWIVSIDNVLSATECEALQQVGNNIGYNVAKMIGKQRRDGTYEYVEVPDAANPAKEAWCVDDCHQNPIIRSLEAKILDWTGIPERNWEYYQLNQYPPSKKMFESHDFAKPHVERPQGSRILSVFVFLTNEKEVMENNNSNNAGLRFPYLDNLTIQSKCGRLVLWPNVMHSHPDVQDARTVYQRLPVSSSTQDHYGITTWAHMRDFKTPHAANCL